jgi:hypothetical protein
VISTVITTTGAAGAAPTPAAVVCPSLRRAVESVVRMAPVTALPFGTGLSCAGTTVRPWARAGITGTSLSTEPFGVAVLDGYAHHTAQRTNGTTPGDTPPRDPLS